MRRIDMSGQKFGRLTVVDYAYTKNGNAHWNCLCECGNNTIVDGSEMRRGFTVSCGCYRKEVVVTHGLSSLSRVSPDVQRAYHAYVSMMQRVSPGNKAAKYYYDRGIEVTDAKWVESAQNFIEDMGPCPPKMSLDRIDNSKGYSKENCKWATRSEQSTNTRKSVVTPELFGKIKRDLSRGMTPTEIDRKYGITQGVARGVKFDLYVYCSRPEYLAAV